MIDEGDIRAALVIPPRLQEQLIQGQRVPVQVIINGDNSNTAATVMGYALRILQSASAEYQVVALPRGTGPPISVEPRVWYNPELRSALFLVPGLIAYIGMISSVISTALSVVREKERGTMEQVRMAPLGTFSYIVGKTLPYFCISMASSLGVILASMVLFGLPMNGSWLLLRPLAVALPGGRARTGSDDFDGGRLAAGRLSDGHPRLFSADDDAVGVRVPDHEHARCDPCGHLCGAGALLPGDAPRHRAERRRTVDLLAATDRPRRIRRVHADDGVQAAAQAVDMKRVLYMMWKEVIELRQDPRIFSIIFIAPILQLTILGYAATTDVRNVPVVIVDADRSAASQALDRTVQRGQHVHRRGRGLERRRGGSVLSRAAGRGWRSRFRRDTGRTSTSGGR